MPDDLLLRNWAQDERFTVTAGGTTLAAYEQPCRDAGAAARAMLAMAAAERWDVPWDQCRAENGVIYHDERAASFAELAMEAARFDPPDPPPLKTAAPFEPAPLSGIDTGDIAPAFPRLDLPSKVDGSHVFAGDVRLPDMVFAAIRHGPHDQAELLEFDATLARGQRGLIQLVRGKRWLAAIADNWWAAEQALQAIAPRFGVARPGRTAPRLPRRWSAIWRTGRARCSKNAATGSKAICRPWRAATMSSPGVHATIETASATARLLDGTLELWLADASARIGAQGGGKGFGDRAPAKSCCTQFRLAAVSTGGWKTRSPSRLPCWRGRRARPVQLTWSRWQEHGRQLPAPARSGLMARADRREGNIDTLRARVASPPTMREFGRRLFDNEVSWAAIDALEGEADPIRRVGAGRSYGVPNLSVEHVPVTLLLPTGADARAGPRLQLLHARKLHRRAGAANMTASR